MGIYAKNIKDLSELPDKASIAIPNDPSNETRALLLLQQAGLITLPNGITDATPVNIITNPKRLKFKEINAAQLPRALQDVDLVAINTNYAIPAGLMPKRDALIVEDADSPYANLIVVRKEDINKPEIKELVDALHSKAVLEKAQEIFQGQAIPAY